MLRFFLAIGVSCALSSCFSSESGQSRNNPSQLPVPQYGQPNPYYYQPQPVQSVAPVYYAPAPASRYYSNPYAFPPQGQYPYYDGDQYYVPPTNYGTSDNAPAFSQKF